jgi:hypothetical protein
MKKIVLILLTLLSCSAYAQTAFTIPNVAITGGTVTGLSSPVPIASGGTGASTAGAAATNLGLAPTLVGTSGSIGGGALLAGACAVGTATVTGATTSMIALTDPVTYPGDGNTWEAYVSASNTVTVKVCAIVAGTPTATTYNVRVIQ